MLGPRAALRNARYAAPLYVERLAAGPGPDAAARRCRILARDGLAATVGYFQSSRARPEEIVDANRAVAARLRPAAGPTSICRSRRRPSSSMPGICGASRTPAPDWR